VSGAHRFIQTFAAWTYDAGYFACLRHREKTQTRGKAKHLRSTWREIHDLMRPRRGVLLLGLLLVGVGRLAGLVPPLSTKVLIDTVIGQHKSALLFPLILGVVVATCIQGITSFALTQLLSKTAQRVVAALRCRVHAYITRLPIAYFDSNKTGVLVSRIMNDVEGVKHLIGTGLVEFVGSAVTAFIVLVALFWINALLTVSALLAILSLALLLRRVFQHVHPLFRDKGKITAELTGRLTESLNGIRVVKGYHAETQEQRVFADGVARLLSNIQQTITATSVMSLSVTVLMGILSALVMLISGRSILANTMTLGDFTAYSGLVVYLAGPMFQIVTFGMQFTEAVAGLERTREVLLEKPEDVDSRRRVSLGQVRGTVEFDNVTFAYELRKTVLKGVSFRAEAGSVTALVGPSGSGKSTVIELIASFRTPGEGVVLVDGTDLATVRLDHYRSQLGIVLQDTFLFDGSIRENVAFSRPEASENSVTAACRIARVDEFAERLPQKYNTVVGERGAKLSGGQKQRISIARAILASPRILILDEATSSLDSESEALIQEGLSYLKQGRTTFIIAHRLSTIRQADQILFLEDGRVAERGTHSELYSMHGRYFDLYTRQEAVQADLFVAD